MAESMRDKLWNVEGEARRLRTLLERYPDVVDTERGYESATLKVNDCNLSQVVKSGTGELYVRFGCDVDGATVWATAPVHVETLLLKLQEHPTGGPALAEVFEAMKAEG